MSWTYNNHIASSPKVDSVRVWPQPFANLLSGKGEQMWFFGLKMIVGQTPEQMKEPLHVFVDVCNEAASKLITPFSSTFSVAWQHVPQSMLDKYLTKSQLNDEVPEKLSYAAVTQGRTASHPVITSSCDASISNVVQSFSTGLPIQLVSNHVNPIYTRTFHGVGVSFPWVHHNPVLYSTVSQPFIPMFHLLPNAAINPQSSVQPIVMQQSSHHEKHYPTNSFDLNICEAPTKQKSPEVSRHSIRTAPVTYESSRLSSLNVTRYPPPPFSPISQFKSPPPSLPKHLEVPTSKSRCSCSSQKVVVNDVGKRQVCKTAIFWLS